MADGGDSMKYWDDWYEYDCPKQGIDFDIRPVPEYRCEISCSACGGKHIADENLGIVWRKFKDSESTIINVTDEWREESYRQPVNNPNK